MQNFHATRLATAVAGLLAAILLTIALPLSAQTEADSHGFLNSTYDKAQEITISGTVSSVLPKALPGMAMGAHLLLTTSTGPVDAFLGKFAFKGNAPMWVAAGQQVELIGVMKSVHERQVLVTRLVKVDGETHRVRNEHGVSVLPQSREVEGKTILQTGGSL